MREAGRCFKLELRSNLTNDPFYGDLKYLKDIGTLDSHTILGTVNAAHANLVILRTFSVNISVSNRQFYGHFIVRLLICSEFTASLSAFTIHINKSIRVDGSSNDVIFVGEDISCKHAKAVKHGNHQLPSSKLGEIDDVAN